MHETEQQQETGTEVVEAPAPPPVPQNRRNALIASIAAKVDTDTAADMADIDEERGEIKPRVAVEQPKPAQAAAPEEPDAPAPAAEAKPTEPAQPAEKRKRTLVVDGTSLEIEEDRIIEAGIRTIQKLEAADRRLQEATRMQHEAESLLSRARKTAPTYEPVQNEPQTATTPPATALDPAALKAEVASEIRKELWNERAQSAAALFRSEFPDIASDSYLMGIAASLEDQRLAHAAQVGEPLGDPTEAYRKHGREITEWLNRRRAPVQAAPALSPDKADRKRTMTAVPAINARAPQSEEPRAKSVQEQIAEMRDLRRMGSRTRQMVRDSRSH